MAPARRPPFTPLSAEKGASAIGRTHHYTWAGRPLAHSYATGGLTFQVTDPHHTGLVAVTANQTVTAVRRYDPFGNPRGTSTGTWPDSHGYLDHPTNTTTGLTHLGARDYNPATGTFISVDPLLDLADPTQWNPYSYADHNPTTLTDPDGTRPACLDDGGCTTIATSTGGTHNSTKASDGYIAPPQERNYYHTVYQHRTGRVLGYKVNDRYVPGKSPTKTSTSKANRKWIDEFQSGLTWVGSAADGAAGIGSGGTVASKMLRSGSSRGAATMSLLARSPGWRAVSRFGRSPEVEAGSRALLGLGAVTTFASDLGDGHSAGYSAGDAVTTTAGAYAGAESGAVAGAIIGSFIGPEGTLIGGLVGGVAGGIAGGLAASGTFAAVSDWLGFS